jgi:hypothetical protein
VYVVHVCSSLCMGCGEITRFVLSVGSLSVFVYMYLNLTESYCDYLFYL